MRIVKIALKAPYTFAVLGMLLMIGGVLSVLQMPKDIFPAINIPVVGIIWTFNGMPAQEMESRITTVSERALTTTVNNIEHIESNSFNGTNVIKVYLQPNASVDAAIAETTAACQAILKTLPAGTTPPNILSDLLFNSHTDTVQALNNLPIKEVNGATIFIRDVANVRDGYTPQVNMVLANGIKAALLPVLKSGSASTLDVVSKVKAALPAIAATLPRELEIKPLFDQSVFVSTALGDVGQEAIIAASLTAAMILLFLGSWRSTVVVATSIPLSICCSVLALHALGQTLNIMTLGGLALAVTWCSLTSVCR